MNGIKRDLLFCVYFVTVCFGALSATQNALQDASQEINEAHAAARPVGRAYSVTTCDYRTQIGYTCLSCNRALHCYPGNVAILVDCYGWFRYCRDGRCAARQGDKCLPDTRLSTPQPSFIDTVVVPDATAPPIQDATDIQASPQTTRANVEATAQTSQTTTAATQLDNVE